MKRLLYLLLVMNVAVYAQQTTQFSQYMHSKFLINPAAIGTNGKLNVTMGYRDQWSGFPTDVQGFFIGGNYVLGEEHSRSYIDNSIRVSNPDLFKTFDSTGQKKHVVGGYVTGTTAFPLKGNAFNALYAFHYPIDEFYISAGAALNINTYRLNLDQIDLFHQNDSEYNNLLSSSGNTGFADLTLGVLFYSHNLYFGYSLNRVAPNKLTLNKNPLNISLNTIHYISAGTQIHPNDTWTVRPSVLIRAINNAPASFDVNTIVEYRDYFMLGLSYRNGDAVIPMAGVTFNHHYTISYSYDITTSTLSTVSNGSHEILLAAKF